MEDAGELQGLDLARLLAEFDTGTTFDWPAALAQAATGQPGFAVEAQLADGRSHVVHAAAVDLQGRRRLIVTVTDVEPVKRAQREREEALAFVSHDLRSPASSIVLLTELHLQGRLQTPQAELLAELQRLAQRTLALSEGFVRAAQAQTQPLQRTPVTPGFLVDEALAELRAQATAAQVQLEVQLHEADTPLQVDRLLVTRAIANLVSNAIKHSPAGATVVLQAALQAGAWQLQVRDEGPGLSAAQQAQLQRGDEGAAVQDSRGVGLGLLFVQRVARRHGGALRALPGAMGRGAVLELVLPAGSAG